MQITSQLGLKQIMQEIKVDPEGIRIMSPKGALCLIRLDAISNIAANILKQEMLSLGAEAAIARGALTGGVKKTGCLLIANLAQLSRLNEKLQKQPFGLGKLAADLSSAVRNYQKDRFAIDLGRHKLILASRARVMGIVNLTPDSFSGDGLYANRKPCLSGKQAKTKNLDYIVDYAQQLVRDGADIIDVGGESSRPGAKPVSFKEELSRVIPVTKALAGKLSVPLSVDTCKPLVAEQALDSGASIVNDITGLKDARMRRIVSRHKATVVIMHMRGNPRMMQNNPRYHSVIDEVREYLESRVNLAEDAGIGPEKIILDPGIGFGKAPEDNLIILKRLAEFKALGRPLLVGTSRKSFIGRILAAGPEARVFGTVSSCLLAAKNGAKIIRTHDVKAVKEALKIMEAIEHA